MYKLLVILLLGIFVSCTGNGDQSNSIKDNEKIICGGYTEFRPLEDSERILFNSLAGVVDGTEYEPVEVSTQVVQGINYRFLAKETGTAAMVIVRIYQPCPVYGEPKLMGIEKLK